MTKIKYIYLLLISAILFAACSKDDVPGGIEVSDDEIAISYSLKKYVQVVTNGNSTKSASETRNINIEAGDEENIDNLYILMVNSGWSDIKRFYTTSSNFAEGTWNADGESVTIKMTQSEAGQRDVYVIANVSDALKAVLDLVNDVDGLKNALETKATPWSGASAGNNLKHPILMSGNKPHNFVTQGRVLSSVELIRAFAKVELNVKLPAKHQAAPTYSSDGGVTELPNYQYNFVDFDKRTYVLENTNKPDDQKASTGNSADTPATWVPFDADGTTDHVSSYEVDEVSGLVTNLKIVTYINEKTNANSYIEIQLPYKDGGFLPPPEFGPETFILPRQGEIKRNHWYKYDVDLGDTE